MILMLPAIPSKKLAYIIHPTRIKVKLFDSTPDTDNSDTLQPQINLEASYPDFYLPSINTDKPGDVLKNGFLKEG